MRNKKSNINKNLLQIKIKAIKESKEILKTINFISCYDSQLGKQKQRLVIIDPNMHGVKSSTD